MTESAHTVYCDLQNLIQEGKIVFQTEATALSVLIAKIKCQQSCHCGNFMRALLVAGGQMIGFKTATNHL